MSIYQTDNMKLITFDITCSLAFCTEIIFKGTHTVYFSSSLYIINQKPMIPRTHFYCITTWVAPQDIEFLSVTDFNTRDLSE